LKSALKEGQPKMSIYGAYFQHYLKTIKSSVQDS